MHVTCDPGLVTTSGAAGTLHRSVLARGEPGSVASAGIPPDSVCAAGPERPVQPAVATAPSPVGPDLTFLRWVGREEEFLRGNLSLSHPYRLQISHHNHTSKDRPSRGSDSTR